MSRVVRREWSRIGAGNHSTLAPDVRVVSAPVAIHIGTSSKEIGLTGKSVTPEIFRQAWSKFGTGVTVITTAETNERDAEVNVHGMTANGVVSVSLDPPLALACIGHNRNSFPLIKANRRFGISILSSDQQDIALHYTKPPEERDSDDHIPFARLGDSTVLAEALTAMDCRVVSEHEAGDHTLFIAEVEHVNIREAEPLLWFQGSFGKFATE